MLDVLPGASRLAAGANLFADAWDMKGLSGLFAEGSSAGKFVGKFGVLGPVGIGLSTAQLGVSIAEGDTAGIIENGLGTGLAVGAVFAPPPVNIACGVAGLGLAAYQNIPAVQDAVNAVGDGIADVADGVGDALGAGRLGLGDEPVLTCRLRHPRRPSRPGARPGEHHDAGPGKMVRCHSDR